MLEMVHSRKEVVIAWFLLLACCGGRTPPLPNAPLSQAECEYEIGDPTVVVPDRVFFEYQYKHHRAPPRSEFTYADTVLAALWRIRPDTAGIHLTVVNRSSTAISIIWEQASYLSPLGDVLDVSVHRKSLSGVVGDRLIEPAATLSAEVFPNGHLTYDGTMWRAGTFLPPSKRQAVEQGMQAPELFVGRSFVLVVPVQHDGRVSQYHFTFPILNAVCPNDTLAALW